MKIAIIGAHGTGKTALWYMLATQCEKLGHKYTLLGDVFKDCLFPGYDELTIDGAYWLVAEQISRELRAKAFGYEVVICNRSTIDPIMYLNTRDFKQSFGDLTQFAEKWMATYDVILYTTPSEGEFVSTDPMTMYQEKVDTEFNLYLESIFINYLKTNIYRISSDDIFTYDVAQILRTVAGDEEWTRQLLG